MTPDEEAHARSALAKVVRRLIPLLALGYLVSYIDRTNVGFAALQMNPDLGLTATQFGLAGGIFYLGYCLVEVPSNLALHRFGARRWLARIMITWGVAAAATALATGPNSYYGLRFLVGVAEAGFFPGVIFYLSTWFPSAFRARVLAWFQVAIPLSSVVSGPLSAALLKLDGVAGIAGWRWLFVVEGLPACLLGLLALKLLVDGPDQAGWLSPAERQALKTMIAEEEAARPKTSVRAAMTDWRVLMLAAIYICFLVGVLGIGLWLPQMLKEHALTTGQIGLVSALPYFVAAIAMVAWARAVDRSRRYVLHYVLACLLAAGGFYLAMRFQSLPVALAGVTLAVVGMNAARAPFFSIPPRYMSGAAAAGGLALINSVGNLGGFIGPYMVGWLKDATGSFQAGLMALSALLFLSAALAALLGILTRKDPV